MKPVPADCPSRFGANSRTLQLRWLVYASGIALSGWPRCQAGGSGPHARGDIDTRFNLASGSSRHVVRWIQALLLRPQNSGKPNASAKTSWKASQSSDPSAVDLHDHDWGPTPRTIRVVNKLDIALFWGFRRSRRSATGGHRALTACSYTYTEGPRSGHVGMEFPFHCIHPQPG